MVVVLKKGTLSARDVTVVNSVDHPSAQRCPCANTVALL